MSAQLRKVPRPSLSHSPRGQQPGPRRAPCEPSGAMHDVPQDPHHLWPSPRARRAEHSLARAAKPANSVKCPSPQTPAVPVLCSRAARGAPRSRGSPGQVPALGFGSSGMEGDQPHRLATASQGEEELGADGICSACERVFLLFMLSGGNASQAFWMAL